MRLSQAGIPTLLLTGNHDLSPALGRAHAIQEFDTLQVPHIRVLDKPCLLTADDLGLPVQVIAIPWVSRSGLVAALGLNGADLTEVYAEIEERLTALVKETWLGQVDESLPVILMAHASVQGALYGSERTVMLGADLVLPGSLVKDPRLDYVALGHIHKPQNLNENAHPPVIYPGSIERVDFGEVEDDKYFVIAEVDKGQAKVEWHKLEGIRPFIDCRLELTSSENVTGALKAALPKPKAMAGAIVRLTVSYPREWETMIDESALREHAAEAFEFHLVKRPQMEARIRLPADQTVSSLSPLDLLEQYWLAMHTEPGDAETLQKLAREIVSDEE